MCMYCKCKTTISSLTTHVVNYKNCIIIIKNVPCEECEQCGEKYYSDEVAKQVESLVNMAKQLMQEIAVIDYSKAAQSIKSVELKQKICAGKMALPCPILYGRSSGEILRTVTSVWTWQSVCISF